MEGDVKVAVVSHEVHDLHRSERSRVMVKGESTFDPLHTNSSAQFVERG